MDSMDAYIQRFEMVIDGLRRKQGQSFKEKMEQLQLGLTRPQFFMLYLIHERGKCSVSTLADKMEVKPSAITVMMDRLVQAGYVTRQHDEQDRRVVLVQLTATGMDTLHKVAGVRKEIMADLLSRLEPGEIDVFLTLFEKVAQIYAPPRTAEPQHEE